MLKKMSFLLIALLATALMGCEQRKTTTTGTETTESKSGKIESGEHGAMTPSQAPAENK